MVSEFLMTGKENAIPVRALCERLEISKRDLAAAVEQERRNGSPICASHSGKTGYYLARNYREMEVYCKVLEKSAVAIDSARREMAVYCKVLEKSAVAIDAARLACLQAAASLPKY